MSDNGTGAGGRTYSVAGMTCAHCQAAVSAEVGGIPGVTSVEVNLADGLVTVGGDGFTDEDVRAAVEEAGYEVVNS